MTDLLPCPFCGSSVDEDDFFVVVTCRSCGATGPQAHGKNTTEALEAWNLRTLPLTKPFLPVADMSQIEAGSITIGDKNGLHMIIDGQGQRIYDSDRLVHNA